MHGEGHPEHPIFDHPRQDAYSLAYRFGWNPEQVLAMNAEVFTEFMAYASGRTRGSEIRRGR